MEQLVEEAMHRPSLDLVVMPPEEAMEPVVAEGMEVDLEEDTEEVVIVQEDMEEEPVVEVEVEVVWVLQKRSPLKRASASTNIIIIIMDGDEDDR